MEEKNTGALTVTIGIPAHNEEKNIGKLLELIVSQKKDFYTLERVVVICDGCDDATANIVRRFIKDYNFITVIDDGTRKGQAARLNQLYQMNGSDILITFDADVLLADERVVETIVRAFDSPEVGLAGAEDRPYPPKTFFEKIVVAGIDLWYETRKDINGGRTIHNHHGCVSAASRKLCKAVEIPCQIIGNDDYRYIKAMELGFQFQYARDAVVYYRAPKNLKDFLSQQGRFLIIKHQMARLFGQDVYKLYPVPMKNKLNALCFMLIRHPLLISLTILLQFALRLFQSRFIKNNQNSFWRTAQSSKSFDN